MCGPESKQTESYTAPIFKSNEASLNVLRSNWHFLSVHYFFIWWQRNKTCWATITNLYRHSFTLVIHISSNNNLLKFFPCHMDFKELVFTKFIAGCLNHIKFFSFDLHSEICLNIVMKHWVTKKRISTIVNLCNLLWNSKIEYKWLYNMYAPILHTTTIKFHTF